ncbi:hypothetical protein PENTCL1PPCAC_18819, partial [Pristionchus entomophagus]
SNMHLLSSALLLLLTVSSSLSTPTAAPSDEEWPTTIETFYATLMYTRINNVTDAPEIQKDDERSGIETEAKPVEETISFNERLDKAERKLEQARRLLQSLTATEEAPAADTVITTTRMCTCAEATECRKESEGQMNQCMEGCYDHMEGYGDKTETYLQCFSKNNASIVEAENCLFKDNKQYCAENGENKTVEVTEWDQYINIAYSPSKNSIEKNALWEKNGKKYTKVQNFFHCTKHCMHKKLNACTKTKGCGIQMHTVDEFSSKLRECTKKNWKINNSLILACQCLAWNNGVKDLQGACVTLGNAYFVDRA